MSDFSLEMPDVPTILRGGRVVDPMNGIDAVRDVAFADGRIIPVEAAHNASVIDVGGYVVTPGLIDMHTHLRDPGQTAKEDIATGTRAAARGGFTTVLMMPNTDPPLDNCHQLSAVRRDIAQKACVNVECAVSLSRESRGESPVDVNELHHEGAVAATDDGCCIQANHVMLEALQRARNAGMPVLDHCEDTAISAHGSLNAGRVARTLGVSGQSAAAEEIMVARDIVLARHTGCHVHIQHVSSAGSVELIKWAQGQGISVSAEVTPHHLSLTEQACLIQGTNAKVNPPLRTEHDRQALLQAVRDGTISVIATDHAPHTLADKDTTMDKAAFGVVGLETAVPVSMTSLYHAGVISLTDVIAAFTTGPEQVLHLGRGTLGQGCRADITILDPEGETYVDVHRFLSKGRNSPFAGSTYRGSVIATIVNGTVVEDGAGVLSTT